MRIILSLLFLLLCFTASYAQNTFSGNVRDKSTKTAISDAVVYISDLKRIAKTDTAGNFSFDKLPEGHFLLEVRAFGYTAYQESVQISGNTNLQIQLEETHTELNEVVITGVSQATERRKNPVSVSIINQKQLAAAHGNNLIDALGSIPGVQSISTGTAISKPVIRGLGYNRIITLYDGMRQEGQQWGDEHGIEIDEFGVDRIEILKGPASLMYGSDGLAGVINILSPKPLPEGKTDGKLVLNYQSNNNLSATAFSLAGNHKGLNWDARISGKMAGNYQNKYDGYVYNSAFNEKNIGGGIGINRSWGFSHLSVTSFLQNIGLPEGERDSAGHFLAQHFLDDSTAVYTAATENELNTFDIFYPRQRIVHHRILWANTFYSGRSRLVLNLGYQQNRRKEFEAPQFITDDSPLPDMFLQLQTWSYDLKYFLPEKKGFSTSFGINGMYQQNKNKAAEFLIPDYNMADAGIYAYSKKSFRKLELSAGLRADWRKLNTEALYIDKNGNRVIASDTAAILKFRYINPGYINFSGSAGATYPISKKTIIKTNLARGFRAPNIAELSANGIHEGTFRYEKGNANLKAESSLQADLGLNMDLNHFTLEAAVFNNHIYNYIYLAKLAAVNGKDSFPNEAEAAPAFSYRQEDATLFGGELMMDFHPHPFDWLHFQNTFSYVRGKLQNKPDSLENLPFMPPASWQSEIRISRKKLSSHLRNISLEMELAHHFAQNNILSAYNTETSTPGYTLLNAGINMEITDKNGKPRAILYLLANNITNKTYQNHLSRLKYAPQNPATGRYGIYDMGRNFSIKIEVPFVLR